MMKILSKSALIVAVWALASAARADSVTLSFVAGSSDIANVASPTMTAAEGAYLGPYYYNLTGWNLGPGESAPHSPITSGAYTGDFAGFCVDFKDNIEPGDSSPFTIEPLSSYPSSSTGNAILGLMWEYANAVATANSESHTLSHLTAALQNPSPGALSDALTIAIWEVLTKTGGTGPYSIVTTIPSPDTNVGLAVTGGSLASPATIGGIITQANTWLGSANLSGAETAALTPVSGIVGDAFALVNTSGPDKGSDPFPQQAQSIVIGFTDGGNFSPAPVPEPASLVGLAGMALMGLAIGVVMISRRRGLKAI